VRPKIKVAATVTGWHQTVWHYCILYRNVWKRRVRSWATCWCV